MSMKRDFIGHDTYTKSITAIGCSYARRELYLGFEDGTIRSLEVDKGASMQIYNIHRGWITSFLYWPTNKLLFCASNDSSISAIGSGGNIIDRIPIGTPVYAMAIWSTRDQNERSIILLAVNGGVQLHALCETKEGFSHYIETQPVSVIMEHQDIVRCLVVGADSRVYSGGFDGALVIYDFSVLIEIRDKIPRKEERLSRYFKNAHAHSAGISCLSVERDPAENTLWIFTGSFDKTLKVWSGDGKMMHKFDNFISSVTGLCFLPKSKTICCVAGTNSGYIFDPKSGEEVTDYVDTFVNDGQEDHYLQILRYFGENNLNIMAASTSRKQIIVYKYHQTGSMTRLKYRQSIDSICYTRKEPILMFVGDSSGSVSKWEQRPSSQLIYSCDFLMKTFPTKKKDEKKKKPDERPKSNQSEATENRSGGKASSVGSRSSAGSHRSSSTKVSNPSSDSEEEKKFSSKEESEKESTNTATTTMPDTHAKFLQFKKSNIVFKLVFVESLDRILAACEDGCIYVWGFDRESLKIIKGMQYINNPDGTWSYSMKKTAEDKRREQEEAQRRLQTAKKSPRLREKKGSFEFPMSHVATLDDDDIIISSKTKSVDNKNVANRVAGFALLAILNQHTSSVSSLVVVERTDDLYQTPYLLSAGWDRRICLWDLKNLKLFSTFQNMNPSKGLEEVELASDGNILDMCYCEKLNYFAYASTDKMCYIRKFSESGPNMTLVNTLQGHLNDVNCVRWNPVTDNWITGSEDCTLRIWSADCECLQIINCSAQVNSIALDLNERVIISACHDTIKIFDMDEFHLLQTSIGHRDSIRDIIFIPERNHIVSVSWDKTINIWRFTRKTESKFKKVEKVKKFETRVLEEMKLALKREVSFHLEDYSQQLQLNTLKPEDTMSSDADFQYDRKNF